jgi:hypothetical protein
VATKLVEPSELVPPDDSGSRTFERYCYQAEIAFRFCLNCALGGDVVAVIAEHFEDIALQYSSSWRFLQIKTRDPARGPWRLSELMGRGGALRSLVRSFENLEGVSVPTTFELYLEGAVAPKDDIQLLLTPNGRREANLAGGMSKTLGLDTTKCQQFLKSVNVTHSLPAREVIGAWNLRLLVSQAGHLPAKVLEATYDRVIGAIETAMKAALLPTDWKSRTCSSVPLSRTGNERFLRKQLTRDHLKPLFASITSPPLALLKSVVEPETGRLSALEEKLIVGGATSEIIRKAKDLRALAIQREIENSAARIWDDGDALEDVRRRLETRVLGLMAEHRRGAMPAVIIWNKLVDVLTRHRDAIDLREFLNRDPELLLGEVCEMSDLCKTDWGIADA